MARADCFTWVRWQPESRPCDSGAAFAVKLGSDPTAWTIRDGRLFIFGDEVGQTTWNLDPAWNIGHAARLWSRIATRGWRAASLAAYLD